MKRTSIFLRALCVCMLLSGLSFTLLAQEIWDGTASAQWSGSGTEADPYLITNAKQLAGLAKRVNGGLDYSGKYFKLTADILLNDTTNWQNWENQAPANSWTPIGDNNATTPTSFVGKFDGNGHTIAGLYIKNYDNGQGSAWETYVGLFGHVNYTVSEIKNLHMRASFISTDNAAHVGLLGGYIYTLSDCSVNGKIIAMGDCQYVGGIVGEGEICRNSQADIAIQTNHTADYLYCGGLVGNVQKTFSNCSSSGTIIATRSSTNTDAGYSMRVGGVTGEVGCGSSARKGTSGSSVNITIEATKVGSVYAGGVVGVVSGCVSSQYIEKCYSVGNVSVYTGEEVSEIYAGSIAGYGYTFDNCFATSNLSIEARNTTNNCNIHAGGLSGTGTIKNSYYTQGKIYTMTKMGNIYAGGLVGDITADNITNSYYNVETSGISDNDNLWAKTTQELKSKLTYNDWEFESVWGRHGSINNGYPYLRWSQAEQVDALDLAVTWEGTGTEKDPYQIGTAEQWRGFVKSLNGNTFAGKHITLTNDIFLNDTTGWLDWEFQAPVNNDAPAGTYNNSFRGHFDGASHTIYGLYIKRDKETNAGLFGVARLGSTFKGVRIAASHIEIHGTDGVNNVGGLVGLIDETIISNDITVDTVSVSECASDVFVYANNQREGYAGGLIGQVQTNIQLTNIYTKGKISAWGYYGNGSGGIIGAVSSNEGYKKALLRDCYAATALDGGTRQGIVAYVGRQYTIKTENCYFDQEVSLQTSENYGALPKLTTEMQRATTYENWDFTNTWGRRNDTNGGYPYLRCFEGKDLLNDVESVVLDKHELVLPIDSTDAKLTASIFPIYHEETACIWTSDSSDIVTVEDGLLVPHKAGETMVRVCTTVGDFVDSCKVTIWVPVDSVVLDYQTLTMPISDTFQLQATIYPLNATNQKVTWKSSYNSYASVTAEGLVTTKTNTGTVRIIVTTEENNFTDTCEITIVRPVTGVKISKETLSLVKGKTSTLSASFTPSNATNKNVIWSNTNPEVASVSESGLVTAWAGGSDTIIVTTEDGGFSDSCFLTVTVPVSGVELERADTIILVDAAYQMQHTVLPLDATNQAVTYSSNNTSVVSITEDGFLTALASGSATITVKTVDGGYRATCKVTVEDHAITGVNLRVDHIALYPDESYILNAVVAPANANKKMLVWSSSDRDVATVDEGVVTAHSAGKATITVATPDQSLTATCLLTVVDTDFANDVLIETTDNSALFTWAKVADAYKYVFAIYTDEAQSQLVCNVTCNAWGQLMDITFPSKKSAAEQPALGTLLQFTIGGLSSGTAYNFTLNGYDEEESIVLNQSGQFVTTGNSSTTSVETSFMASPNQVHKVLENGTIYILRNGEKYTIDGRKVSTM